MNICIFIVNFQSDCHAIGCVMSIIESAKSVRNADLKIYVYDNSEKANSEFKLFFDNLRAIDERVTAIKSPRNLGYFGFMGEAQRMVDDTVDCAIYCNSDILFDRQFFSVLSSHYKGEKAILAPCVISGEDGYDQNPIYSRRVSKQKMKILQLVYSSRFFLFVYAVLAFVRESMRPKWNGSGSNSRRAEIYAAHGSIFVFLDTDFFRRLPKYPCFLFLEELFVAEEARLRGVRTIHASDLVVRHEGHVSIAKLSARGRQRYLAQSIACVIDKYYQ